MSQRNKLAEGFLNSLIRSEHEAYEEYVREAVTLDEIPVKSEEFVECQVNRAFRYADEFISQARSQFGGERDA